jgi:Uncharacterized protein conserved in bacteria (DUF2188)
MPLQLKTRKKISVVSEEVGNYEKHPFFVKKTITAAAFLKNAGLPPVNDKKSSGTKKHSSNFHSTKNTQHVVPHHGGWAVKGLGNEKATIVTSTQKKAIEAAREIARNKGAEVVIFGRDGNIRHRDSYNKKK